MLEVNLALFDSCSLVIVIKHKKIEERHIVEYLNALGNIYFHSKAVGGISTFIMAIKIDSLNEIENLKQYFSSKLLRTYIVKPESIKIPVKELDFKIIKQLALNPRRDIKDLSAALSVSTKTIYRRLARLIKNHIISFSIFYNFTFIKGYIHYVIHILVNRHLFDEVLIMISKDIQNYTLIYPMLKNRPNLILMVLLDDDIRTIDSNIQKIQTYAGVDDVEVLFETEMKISLGDLVVREADNKLS